MIRTKQHTEVIGLQVSAGRNEAKGGCCGGVGGGGDEWVYFPKQKDDLDTVFFFPFLSAKWATIFHWPHT